MKPKILVVTSSFPRNQKENKGFIFEFYEYFTNHFEILFLASHTKKSKTYESWNPFKIYRHKITPWGDFGLAYDSGILPNLKKNPLLWFLVPFYFLSQIFKIYNLLKKEKIRLIHSHWLIPCGFSVAFCKKFFFPNLKIVLICHGSDSFLMSIKAFDFLSKFILKQADEIFVTNQEIQEKVQLLVGKQAKIPAIGIHSQKFLQVLSDEVKEQIKKTYQLHGKVLLFVGWIIYEKGISYLIHSMKKICETFPDTKLLVLGVGNLQEEMIALMKQLNLHNSVFFLGAISNDEIYKFYQVADIFVLPSFKEGMPISVMEALLSETYVLLSELPAADSIDNEKQIIFRCQMKEADSISHQVIDILENFDLYRERKKQGKQLILETFDNSVIFQSYKTVSEILFKKIQKEAT